MKTAEKILLTSLELFNQHGEANITCVDIALELDISPGNLYYHFRGKEAIIDALFDMYLARTSKILVSPSSDQLSIASFFHYLSSLLESAHLFSFIYRNPTDLLHKYPSITKRFNKLIASKKQAFDAILTHFQQHQIIIANTLELESLSQLINLVFTQSQSYFLLTQHNIQQREMSLQSLRWLFHTISPYLNVDDEDRAVLLAAIDDEATFTGNGKDQQLLKRAFDVP